MRFLSAETAACEIDVDSTVGLAELYDPASEVKSLILLLAWVTTVIVLFLLLKDTSRRRSLKVYCQDRPSKTFTAP
jgi:hypothetical protein